MASGEERGGEGNEEDRKGKGRKGGGERGRRGGKSCLGIHHILSRGMLLCLTWHILEPFWAHFDKSILELNQHYQKQHSCSVG